MIKKHWKEVIDGDFWEKNQRLPPDYVLPALEAHFDVIKEWSADPELCLEMFNEGIDPKWVSMEVGSISFEPTRQYRVTTWVPLQQSEEV